MITLKDATVYQWVGGECTHVSEMASAISYQINGKVIITLKNGSQALPE